MKHFIVLLFSALFLIACNSSDSKEEQEAKPGETPLEEYTYEDVVQCLQDPYHICEGGIQSASLGGYLADIILNTLDATEERETLENGSGYVWLVRTVNLLEGKMMIEGEFIDERQADSTSINDSKINRIRIESNLFSTEEDLKVGDRVEDILKVYPDASFYFATLPDYGVADISRFNSRIHYLIPLTKEQMASADTAAQPFDYIPKGQKIQAIVIM